MCSSDLSATNSWCERGIDYDLNGNIVTLQRFGSNASAAEDDLSYSYNGNRLVGLAGSSQGAELNASYSYDAGGNMVYDGRRGLGISYNMLNLPARVVEKSGATAADGAVKAEYLYSADGIKQRVVDGAGSNGYLYLGTLVLSKSGESYSLASTGFGGGRIVGGAGNSCLAYYYGTDHLGSVVERNDYYPMGMRTSTGNSYPQLTANLYKYNGKEVQTVGGLGFTDYGARMYDDFTGRWFVPDTLAEKYASMSPYMYCGGNPILMVDVDGQEVKPKGAKELEMIQNTIPAELRSFVRVNDHGNIDKSLINSYNGNINSGNYNNLKQMVNSNLIVEVELNNEFTYMMRDGNLGVANMSYNKFDPIYDLESDKDKEGNTMSNLSTGESGFLGKTLFPDREGIQNSPNKHIMVIVNKNLSKQGAAEIYSHEAYGHALLYILNGSNHEGASHQPINGSLVEGNLRLKQMIINSKKETIKT